MRLALGLLVAFLSIALAAGCSDVRDGGSDDDSRDAAINESEDAASDATGDDLADTSTSVDAANNDATQDTASEDTGADPQDVATVDAAPDTAGDDAGLPFENDCESGPLAEPIEGCSPAPWPSTGDPYEDCVRRINQLRWECQCLPPLERWHEGESCADQQATHDAQNNTPHDGFSSGICSPRGSAQNECPGWGSWERANGGCLQMMWDEGPGEPYSEHGHYINMTNSRYSKVACGGGDGWFVQNFQ